MILDGENAWEFFPDDGTEFLKLFYQTLNDDPEIETVTFSEMAEHLPSRRLTSVLAGSWINHNFRIWIGHHEDNTAWDLLSRARKTLVGFQEEHPDFDSEKLNQPGNRFISPKVQTGAGGTVMSIRVCITTSLTGFSANI